MRKKIIVLVLSLAMLFGFTACGGSGAGEQPAAEPSVLGEADAEQRPTSVYKDMILEVDEGIIEITSAVLGRDGRTESDMIVFYYTYTNTKSEARAPATVWDLNIYAVQDNDSNAVNTLEGGSIPMSFIKEATYEVRIDEEANSAGAFVLSDMSTPVTLIAKKSGEVILKQPIPIS